MNILFANYGDYETNSINHIAPFANRLCEQGISCIVAVPGNKGSAGQLETAYFQPATFNDCLGTPNHFPNALPADIIHAWTPRECVRKFVENYCKRYDCKVVVHLEDNEEHLISSYYRTPIEKLPLDEPPEGFDGWHDELSHPVNYRAFLALADATTTVIDKLRDFTSQDRPSMELLPGIDFEKFQHESTKKEVCELLDIEEKYSIIVYTGGVTSSNREDIRALYLATKLVNDQGHPLKLIKTGPNKDNFNASFAFDVDQYVIDIGIQPKEKLPKLLKAADILVQPGKANAFNLYRLPSKLPEFLAAGKPVITSNANLALRMGDGGECLKLDIGAPREIADLCIRIIENPELGHRLGQKGKAFAEKNFSIHSNTAKLLEFYELILKSPSRNWITENKNEGFQANIAAQRIQELGSINANVKGNARKSPSLLSLIHCLKRYKTFFDRPEATQKEPIEEDSNDELIRGKAANALAQQEIERLEDENRQLNEAIRRLKNTMSWRLTMPLRALRRKVVDPFIRKDELPEESEAKIQEVEEPALKDDQPQSQLPPAYRDYRDFCKRLEPKIDQYMDNFLERIDKIERPPLISIIMPVFNTEEKWLSRSINSVINQIYPNWQLCIADDASTKANVRDLLAEYQNLDERIEVVFRKENGHISAASNSALDIAQGSYIALLDHDDELPPHALARVVDAIANNPNVKLIYTDEDKISEDGERSQPHFKSDWNPDLLLGQNYISHLGVYQTSVARQVGGFREGFEGAQDWDLALRVSEKAQPNQIIHIPEVLYHWRSIQGSTAADIDEKDYAHEAGGKAISSALERRGFSMQIEPVERYYWRPKYPIPDNPPEVSIIIPTRNRLDLLKPCIDSILEKTSYENYRIHIVDNNSDDIDTLDYLNRIVSDGITVQQFSAPFNFAAINNASISQSKSDIICMLNNDITVISEDWLEELVSHASRPEIGAVGAKLFYPHEHIQHAGIVMGIGGVASEAFKRLHRTDDGYIHRACLIGNYSAITGACMAFRKSVWKDISGFNEIEVPNAFGDVDFCLKARKAGFRNLFTPFAELHHHESASRGNDLDEDKIEAFNTAVEYMKLQWGDEIEKDPYYNPNLTLEREDFTLAREPRFYSVA